jgi:alcohol dehydrogenase (NADP+)
VENLGRGLSGAGVDQLGALTGKDRTRCSKSAPWRPADPDRDLFSLIVNQRALAGSRIGGLEETEQMLDFCAKHGIGAVVEVIGAGEVEAAYARLATGEVRFRFVINACTIASPGAAAQAS